MEAKKTKLKYHFKFGMGETILREEVSDNPSDGYPVYSATEDDKVFGYKSDIKRILDAGDIVIAARGTIGSVNILKEKGGCTQTTMYMKNLGDFDSKYVYYYMLGHRDSMFAYDKTAIPQLTIGKFSNETILLPSMDIQNKIVTFLDKETSRIDGLSAELTKFKANLQLQKRSLVSECVTKGLPSERNRAYKDSGVEWLGEVPASWGILPLFTIGNQNKLKNKNNVESNLLSLSYGNIIRKDINSNMGLLPESFETYQIVEPNDLVFRFTDLQNDHRSLRSAMVKEKGIITSAYIGFKLKSNVVPKYMSHLMRTYDIKKVFYTMGSGLRQSLKFSDVQKMPIIVPPLDEQKRIADYLDVETARIDSLMAEIDNQIALLKTYRKSLINEVVTGKVEV